MYLLFRLNQTVQHRDLFLPVTADGELALLEVHAFRAATRDWLQISLNLSYGSAMASIALTIPAIAIASIWLDGPLLRGLGSVQLVLLILTMVTSILTVIPGRATRLQGAVHLILFAAFLFLSVSP